MKKISFLLSHTTPRKNVQKFQKNLKKRNCHVISTLSGTLLRRSLLGTDGEWTPPSFPREKARAFPTVPGAFEAIHPHFGKLDVRGDTRCARRYSMMAQRFSMGFKSGFELVIPKRYIFAQGSP